MRPFVVVNKPELNVPSASPSIIPPAICAPVLVFPSELVVMSPAALKVRGLIIFKSAVKTMSALEELIAPVMIDPASDEITLFPTDDPGAISVTSPAVLRIVAVPPLSYPAIVAVSSDSTSMRPFVVVNKPELNVPPASPSIIPPAVCDVVRVLSPDIVLISPTALRARRLVKSVSAIKMISAFEFIAPVVTDPVFDLI